MHTFHCNPGFPNFQTGKSFEASSPFPRASGDCLHLAGLYQPNVDNLDYYWQTLRSFYLKNFSTATKNFFSWSSSSLSVASSLPASPISLRLKKYVLVFLRDLIFNQEESQVLPKGISNEPYDKRILVSPQSRLRSTGLWSRWQPSDTETSTPRRLLARFDRNHFY